MLKFNNDNIITGHIKQLLSEFHLPKYRVFNTRQYTPEVWEEIQRLKAYLDAIYAEQDLNHNVDEVKEVVRKLLELGYTDINIIPTVYRTDYPQYARTERVEQYPNYLFYAPYIKDGKIQEYTDGEWKECHAKYSSEAAKNHDKVHLGGRPLIKYYHYNKPELNYTKNLQIKNNIYDSYTHEYLGDYLRFQRDYNNLNLMPLYNCFSNRDCEHLDLSVAIDSAYTAEFKTSEDYKIYMVPVKLFQKYTIAIDCESSIEMCCGLYGKYQYKDTSDVVMTKCLDKLAKATYTCFNAMQFKKPVLFDKLFDIKAALFDYNVPYLSRVAAHENALKLFIKVPKTNKSSITILEGDYTAYNDTAFIKNKIPMSARNKFMEKYLNTHPRTVKAITELFTYLVKPFAEVLDNADNEAEKTLAKDILKGFPSTGISFYENEIAITGVSKTLPEGKLEELKEIANFMHLNESTGKQNDILKQISSGTDEKAHTALDIVNKIERNNTIINFEINDFEEVANKLITPLQLLRTNTGTSYPFADRLIEYLVGNVVTPLDDISDNISRAKSIAKANCNLNNVNLSTPGLWTSAMQILFYRYIMDYYNTNDINHDILGYVDKDVEKLYKVMLQDKAMFDINGNRLESGTTISQVNIYSEWKE